MLVGIGYETLKSTLMTDLGRSSLFGGGLLSGSRRLLLRGLLGRGGLLGGGSSLLGSGLLGGGLLLRSRLLLGSGLLLGQLGATRGTLGLLEDTLLDTVLERLVEERVEHVVRHAQAVVGLDVLLEGLTAGAIAVLELLSNS